MTVYLHVSFNFRHVSAAHGPSSGKCLLKHSKMSVYLHVSFNFRHVSAAHGPSSDKCLLQHSKMSVYLHMSFNFRHVSAAHVPSSGKSLITGETTALSTSLLSDTSSFCCISFLEYCHSILLRLSQFFMPGFPVYALWFSLPGYSPILKNRPVGGSCAAEICRKLKDTCKYTDSVLITFSVQDILLVA
jgi:hypothetical protein